MSAFTAADAASVAVVTLCSSDRLDHVRHQLAATARHPSVHRIIVWVGGDEPPPIDADEVLRVPPGRSGLRLAAGRKAGAAAAVSQGCGVIVFLDADCVPGPDLLERYHRAARTHPDAVLCGPVTYLPEDFGATDPAALAAATSPHPARPHPSPGELRAAPPDEYPLFWSLSFATTAELWLDLPGFDERYEGYGGEDTDFAFMLREGSVPLIWVGGAHAYHQHHPTQSPPWQHLDDILRNGALFAARWGEWPMTGWLQAFEAAGAVSFDGSAWHRVSAGG